MPWALVFDLANPRSNMPAKIAIMAMTTSNSMSVDAEGTRVLARFDDQSRRNMIGFLGGCSAFVDGDSVKNQ